MATRSTVDLADAFGAAVDETRGGSPVAPDWNVAPSKPVIAVTDDGAGRRLTIATWGLVLARGGGRTRRIINARVETVTAKGIFAAGLRAGRCLLPADGYYEWSGGTPYALLPADGRPFAFAGFAVGGGDPAAPHLSATVILTGAADAALAWLHDRAPLVVPERDWDRWLAPAPVDADLLAALVPATRTAAVPRSVGRAVGDVRNNGPGLLDPPAAASSSGASPGCGPVQAALF